MLIVISQGGVFFVNIIVFQFQNYVWSSDCLLKQYAEDLWFRPQSSENDVSKYYIKYLLI
jgi:hypothetical protein